MSSAAAPSPATPQQVTCETSDQQQIAVELEVLRMSHTFDDMYKNLGLEEGDEFPGTYPVKSIEARVFKKVVDWCTAHKGQPDPVVEKDPLTKETKWFEFTDYDRMFFDLPVPELLELIMAASYLEIRGLYHYGCRAIAGLVKGRETLEARYILQQEFDLMRTEVSYSRSLCPWLNRKADVVGTLGDVSNPIHIPNEVLTTIFEKLTRADLERLQLVSQQFRNIILQSDDLPLRLLNEIQFTTLDNHWDYCARRCTLVLGVGNAKCLQGCAVRKLEFRTPISSEDCTLLLDAKPAWKNAFVSVSVYRFTSPATRTAALTDILFCKKLRVTGSPERSPHSFMHLPAIRSCNHLDMRWISFTLKKGWPLPEPTGVIEWLEHEPAKEWDEPRQIELWAGDHCDVKVVDALKKAFLSATSHKPYVLRIRASDTNQANELLSNAIGEQLHIRFESDGSTERRSGDVVVERE